MFFKKTEIPCVQIRFSIVDVNEKEIARANLIVGKNDLHAKPFGLLEDVFVAEDKRGKGYGLLIVKQVIFEARRRDCYKLIATSRNSREGIHEFYRGLGFKDWGREFRIDF